jgi:hypothetical protein
MNIELMLQRHCTRHEHRINAPATLWARRSAMLQIKHLSFPPQSRTTGAESSVDKSTTTDGETSSRSLTCSRMNSTKSGTLLNACTIEFKPHCVARGFSIGEHLGPLGIRRCSVSPTWTGYSTEVQSASCHEVFTGRKSVSTAQSTTSRAVESAAMPLVPASTRGAPVRLRAAAPSPLAKLTSISTEATTGTGKQNHNKSRENWLESLHWVQAGKTTQHHGLQSAETCAHNHERRTTVRGTRNLKAFIRT